MSLPKKKIGRHKIAVQEPSVKLHCGDKPGQNVIPNVEG
jgi:hypothetical protein